MTGVILKCQYSSNTTSWLLNTDHNKRLDSLALPQFSTLGLSGQGQGQSQEHAEGSYVDQSGIPAAHGLSITILEISTRDT